MVYNTYICEPVKKAAGLLRTRFGNTIINVRRAMGELDAGVFRAAFTRTIERENYRVKASTMERACVNFSAARS